MILKLTDTTTAYAEAVLEGRIVAGPLVRGACQRHFEDLKRTDITFDTDKAGRAIDFFHSVLRLNGGEFEGKPFKLIDFQSFIVGSIYGWLADDGYRRFRVAYIETGKGSGKSPLVAGMGLYCLTADGEDRAEVYAAAVKKDQAKVLFRDAVAMVEMSPELSARLRLMGGVDKHRITYTAKGSFFVPISSEERGRGHSGPRPHCAILDEIHEHPTNTMVEMMRAGTKQRRQALIIMITNSGADKHSSCWEYHEYVRRIYDGEVEDDGFFGYVCSLDETDEPFEDESCWIKANPALEITPGLKYLREQVREAKGMPSKESLVRRLNFCQWIEGVNPLFSRDVWLKTLRPLTLDDFRGMQCVGGVDLSSTTDLTALALTFNVEGILKVVVLYWMAKGRVQGLVQTDRVPYDRWIREGFIEATPGQAIDYDWIAKKITTLESEYDITIKTLSYDSWGMKHLIKAFDDAGVPYHESEEPKPGEKPKKLRKSGIELRNFRQGYRSMSPAIKALEIRVLNEAMVIEENPVTNMCAANVAVNEDASENRKLDKSKSTGRIDGMVAMVMSVQTAILEEANNKSVYKTRGIRFA